MPAPRRTPIPARRAAADRACGRTICSRWSTTPASSSTRTGYPEPRHRLLRRRRRAARCRRARARAPQRGAALEHDPLPVARLPLRRDRRATAGMRNFMSYERRWLDEPHVGDHVGRSIWALGEVLSTAWVPAVVGPARRLLALSSFALAASSRCERRRTQCSGWRVSMPTGSTRSARACRALRRRSSRPRTQRLGDGLALVRGRTPLRQRAALACADRRRQRPRTRDDGRPGSSRSPGSATSAGWRTSCCACPVTWGAARRAGAGSRRRAAARRVGARRGGARRVLDHRRARARRPRAAGFRLVSRPQQARPAPVRLRDRRVQRRPRARRERERRRRVDARLPPGGARARRGGPPAPRWALRSRRRRHDASARALPPRPANPILTAADWPYPVNAVFNPAAALVDGETVLLARVEDSPGSRISPSPARRTGSTAGRSTPSRSWRRPRGSRASNGGSRTHAPCGSPSSTAG